MQSKATLYPRGRGADVVVSAMGWREWASTPAGAGRTPRPRPIPGGASLYPRRLALMTGAWCSLRSGEIRGLRRRDHDIHLGV